MEILLEDRTLVVCVKPAGVLSTDEPGGLPELLRQALGEENIRTVHRLDRVVGGVMLLARTKRAAAELSEQIRADALAKEYLAVVRGAPEIPAGTLRDWLHRDKGERKTYVVPEGSPEAQEAVLEYAVLQEAQGYALLRIRLHTGRTHQIRCQFAARGLPLVGDKKYGSEEACEGVALWSHRLRFTHPRTGEQMDVAKDPPETWPWTLFAPLHEA